MGTQYIEQAMDNFLSAYDMILLMFDLSESRSFYELNKIFDRMPKNHSLPIQVLASKADLKHVQQFDLDKNVKYRHLEQQLNDIGLYQYAQTWLNPSDSCDFPQLFDDLFFIATNPHFRRLKISKIQQTKSKNNLEWKTVLKRTVTITAATTLVLFGAYTVYKWLYPPPLYSNAVGTQPRHHRYRR